MAANTASRKTARKSGRRRFPSPSPKPPSPTREWSPAMRDTLGQYGFAKDPNEPRPGELIVAIIDPGGKIRLKQATNRQNTRYLHAPPYPLAHGLIVDEASDWMIVRIHDLASDEIWWTYRLSTGAALQRLTPHLSMPDGGALQWIVDAKLVRGTPLVLLHWWRADFSRVGARFALVDREAKPVWSLELPRDYMAPGESREGQIAGMDRRPRRHPAIRPAQPVRSLLRRRVERVTFAVTKKRRGNGPSPKSPAPPFDGPLRRAATCGIPQANFEGTGFPAVAGEPGRRVADPQRPRIRGRRPGQIGLLRAGQGENVIRAG